MLSHSDRRQISELGITEQEVLAQVETFKQGFPFVNLMKPCTPGDGIEKMEPRQAEEMIRFFEDARKTGRLTVFVPASGAATRMFKSALAVFHQNQADASFVLLQEKSASSADMRDVSLTLEHFHHFAFWPELSSKIQAMNLDAAQLAKEKKPVPLLKTLLTPDGMGYSELPKGLLRFHRYSEGSGRTAFEEHVWEAAIYAADKDQHLRMHFTVSKEHEGLFLRELERFRPSLEAKGFKLDLTFSNQLPSTDTLAVDLNNDPFRDSQGRLVFRPAGHGALLKNLETIGCDIVFIKNIDNIQPDDRKAAVAKVQKEIAGFLLQKQALIFDFLNKLEKEELSGDWLQTLKKFVLKEFDSNVPDHLSSEEKRTRYFDLLNRPIRVCGMVRNQGEPGGGPFWVKNASGAPTRQIVEKSQIDLSSPAQKKLLESSTHFNPVNLVCGLRDYKGRAFELSRFVDPQTGFISAKSKDGKELRALELPGLWNGAMAGWITYFLETPPETFAPVKELNDLLRPEHQPSL